MLAKLAKAMVSPSRWKELFIQLGWLVKGAVKYRTFSFNQNSRNFWDSRFREMDTWRDEHYPYVIRLLPHSGTFTLLDVGCALGDGCELMRRELPDADITGVDISEVAIGKAAARGSGVKYIAMDILKSPLPDRYDYVTIVQTLEHFDDPFSVVDACIPHVKKEMLISVPYTPGRSGPLVGVHWHRYFFDDNTFSRYNAEVALVTENFEDTNSRSIIFRIRPENLPGKAT